jgi:predicted dehydrogenase
MSAAVSDNRPCHGTASASAAVGMVGYGFMGRAHSFAYRAARSLAQEPALLPQLEVICGRHEGALEKVRARYGWSRTVSNWRELVEDDQVEIFDNSAPNALHLQPTLLAAKSGKHLFCEKPLGLCAKEAHTLWMAARAAHMVHMCGFNLRFIPAVRLAREMLDAGELGDVTHFRAQFLASSALDPKQAHTWRFRRDGAGSGALGDLASHLIDLARYLVGELSQVSACMKTFVTERSDTIVDVDDAVTALVVFLGGAIGSVEASRVAGRHSNCARFEVDGTRGSLGFELARLNELKLTTSRKHTETIDVTDTADPFMAGWWPSPGHSIGWGDSFTHEVMHLLRAVRDGASVRPHGADFEDGYRAAEVCDAIARSAATGRRETITYRSPSQSTAEPRC